jgi:ATP-dependent protease HslVU (ClpYQ) peptidase subunit
MTCVIGLVQRKRIYIGADSAAVGNRFIRTTNLPKVFRKGPFLIGYCGSFRMGQVLEYCLEVPAQRKDEPVTSFLVNGFIEGVRSALKAKGVAAVEQNKEKGGQFLVGYKGRLYSVNSDFHVGDMLDEFDCIGSGAPVALGAMKALEGLGPKQRIERALEITAYYTPDVCGPFHILSMGAEK